MLPNILWLTCEDMSPDLGCYGDTYADTPHIDRLASRSIRYTRAFAESPMCAPSRSALITGMHTGPLGTSQMRSAHRVPRAFRGFPTWLRQAGYYTTNNSKTDYNLLAENFLNAAWDESSNKAHWRKRPAGKPFFSVFNYTDTHQSMASRDDYAAFVNKVQSRLSPGETHDPANAPLPPFYSDTATARRTVARYYDCISTLDDWIRDMLDQLEIDGLAQDTIVFFFSDHGAGMPGGKAAAFHRGLKSSATSRPLRMAQ
jgi:arylsulfatase A-like enzyme